MYYTIADLTGSLRNFWFPVTAKYVFICTKTSYSSIIISGLRKQLFLRDDYSSNKLSWESTVCIIQAQSL